MRRFARRALTGFARLLAAGVVCGGSSALVWATWRCSGIPGLAGAAILIAVLVLKPAYRNIPTLQIGMTTFLGMRTGRVLPEGPALVIPWLEKVWLFDYEVHVARAEAKVYCKDGIALVAGGLLSWQIDPDLLSTSFVLNREKIESELVNAARSELGMIASVYGALELKDSWEAVANLINCSLRMGTPPHIAESIPPARRLDFYGSIPFRNRLEREPRLDEERSEIENRCGVRIICFTPEPPEFTEGTGEALESEGRAILKSKADRVAAATKLEITRKAKEEGLPPKEASVSAELTMGQRVERKIHDLGGLERLRPFLPPESRTYGGAICLRN